MFFDVRCPGCGTRGWCPCERCVASLVPPEPAFVSGASSVHALFGFEGVGQSFVHALKYDNERAIARWLSASLSLAVRSLAVDVVTWVPAAPANRRHRGFDQGRVLARGVARRMKVPARSLLRRSGVAVQTGASRSERLAAPNLVATSPLSGARVLVIDDVLTTGASVERATAALLGAGASTVHAAVCARTADVSLENPTDGVLEQHRWSA